MVFRLARLAAGLGVGTLLIVSCSTAITGSAVRDSTAAVPVTGTPDWSTASPSPSAPSARTSVRPTTLTRATSEGDRTASSTGRPAGDLGLTEMISQVPCDGRAIVLLGSATTPGAYARDVQQLLQIHPGSHYLRTDGACSSLTQQSDDGHQIYAVFYGPYEQASKACEVLQLTGGDAQVRVLRDSGKPLGPEEC